MHNIRIGRIAEIKFSLKCLEKGFKVFEPLVDDFGVDFIIRQNNITKTIQVKSTKEPDKSNPNTYKISIKRGAKNVSYDKKSFDYLAVYLFDRDLFYLIPLEVASASCIRISPDSTRCKYRAYKDVWLLT
jgi:hypothetical protein